MQYLRHISVFTGNKKAWRGKETCLNHPNNRWQCQGWTTSSSRVRHLTTYLNSTPLRKEFQVEKQACLRAPRCSFQVLSFVEMDVLSWPVRTEVGHPYTACGVLQHLATPSVFYPPASLAFSQFLNRPYWLDHRTFVCAASSTWKSLLHFPFLPS